VAAVAFGPFTEQGAGGDGDLIGRGGDAGFNRDPVGTVGQVGVHAVGGAVALERGHEVLFG